MVENCIMELAKTFPSDKDKWGRIKSITHPKGNIVINESLKLIDFIGIKSTHDLISEYYPHNGNLQIKLL